MQKALIVCVRARNQAPVADYRRCKEEDRPPSETVRCSPKPCPAEWVICYLRILHKKVLGIAHPSRKQVLLFSSYPLSRSLMPLGTFGPRSRRQQNLYCTSCEKELIDDQPPLPRPFRRGFPWHLMITIATVFFSFTVDGCLANGPRAAQRAASESRRAIWLANKRLLPCWRWESTRPLV